MDDVSEEKSFSVWHCQDHMDLSYDNDRCAKRKFKFDAARSRRIGNDFAGECSLHREHKTSSSEWANERITREQKKEKENNQQLWKNGFSCIFVFHFTKFIFSIILSLSLRCMGVCLQMSPHSTTIIHSKFSPIVETSYRVSEFIYCVCVCELLCHSSGFGLKTNSIPIIK